MSLFTFLQLLAAASLVSSHTVYQGFNYGSTFVDSSCRSQADYETSFRYARNLPGMNNTFTSARLYTSLPCEPDKRYLSAIDAAVITNTSLLLGIWATNADHTDLEVEAIKAAVSNHGMTLVDLVVGISVGNEDLYHYYTLGENEGTSPTDLTHLINRVRGNFFGTLLNSTSIGHVDTFDAWAVPNSTRVIEAVDWLGGNAFPYWANISILDAAATFIRDLNETEHLAHDKEVWLTETGWPWCELTPSCYLACHHSFFFTSSYSVWRPFHPVSRS